jgi:G3E family GTPase
VRGDLIRILGNLMKRRDKFDHILVETTGMADPGPVAQTFFVDEDMSELFRLDSIVTLVDAKHFQLHVDDSAECRQQVAFADVLVLNKSDLVPGEALEALERRVRSMNGMAQVHRAAHADVPIARILDVGGFDLDRALAHQPTFLEPEYPFEWAGTLELAPGERLELVLSDGPDPVMDVVVLALPAGLCAGDKTAAERALRAWSRESKPVKPSEALHLQEVTVASLQLDGAGEKRFGLQVERPTRVGLYLQHLPSEFDARFERAGGSVEPIDTKAFSAGHTHDDEVGSVGVHLEKPLDREKINQWISKLLREKGTDIFRMKGILSLAGSDNRFVYQGVHMLFDGRDDRPWGDAARASDLVFIGRNLDREELVRGVESCVA